MMALVKMFGRVPWSILIVLAMWLSYAFKTQLSGGLGLAFDGLCVVVLIVEFFKSGDIRIGPFMLDLVFAAAGLVAASVLMTLLVMGEKGPGFHYFFGCFVLLVDAILSPFNSFRTALRNVQFGDGN